MDPLEIQLRRCTRSWKALLGALATSALLFVTMAATSAVVHPHQTLPERPLTYTFTPPPPPPMKQENRPAVAASAEEAFKFDPTMASPPPEIPLEMLEINLDPAVNPGVAIAMDMHRTFEVQKPDAPDRVVIFERGQVDEIPVFLYGSQPRVPSRFDKTDWNVSVLFVVSEKGHASNVYILDATDAEMIDPVKAAIASWRFRPARKDGKAVKQWVQQLVTFTPENKSPFSL